MTIFDRVIESIRVMERIAVEAVEAQARAEIALIDYRFSVQHNHLRREYDRLLLERADLRVRRAWGR